MAKKNYGGVYANMEFPPYEYVPYPRHIITGPNGLFEVAHSEQDEKEIKTRLRKERDEAPEESEAFAIDPEKEILISRARELSVPINRKWSKEKLGKVVRDAEDAIDNLPPEDDQPVKQSQINLDDEPAEDFVEEPKLESTEDKAELIAQAKALGIPATFLWGVPRLKASIAEAQAKN